MLRPRIPRAALGLVAAAVCFAGAVAGFRWMTQDGIEIAPEEYGRTLMAAGDYRLAAETLRAAYRAAPTETLRIELSRALLSVGDYAGALEILNDGAAPSAAALRYLRAEAMIRSERYVEAGALVREISGGGDGAALLLAARASYGLGDIASAKEELAQAFRAKNGAPPGAWSFRARLALDANDLDAARAAIARAGEAGAATRETELLKAEALLRDGDFAGARRSIDALPSSKGRRAQRVDPQKEYLLARVDAAAGDFRSAARRLRGVKALVAGEPNASLVTGLVYEGSGDTAQAERELMRGLANAPEDPRRLDALAAFFIRARRLDEAAPIIDRLLAASPDAGALRRIELFIARDDADGAVALAKRRSGTSSASTASAVAFGPRSAAAKGDARALKVSRALIDAAGAIDDASPAAISNAAKALSALEESAVARLLAGELLLAVGADADAKAEFDAALALAPASTSALIGRLRIDVRADDLYAAEKRLSSIVAEDAGKASARLAMARVLAARDRPAEAAALLRPIAALLAASREETALYVALLRSIGASGEIAAFVDDVRRARPVDPDSAELLAEAGRLDEARLVARDALLREPANASRMSRYVALMEERGRAPEAAALLKALGRRYPHPRALIPGDALPVDEKQPVTLAESRAAYFAAPTDPAAASRYGMALEEAGLSAQAERVRREAVFWRLGVGGPLPEAGRS